MTKAKGQEKVLSFDLMINRLGVLQEIMYIYLKNEWTNKRKKDNIWNIGDMACLSRL